MEIRELKQRIDRERAAVEGARRGIEEARQRAGQQAERYRQAVAAHYDALLAQSSEAASRLVPPDAPYLRGDLLADAWRRWTPSITEPPPLLIAGELTDVRAGGFRLPFAIPFIGQACTLIVPSSSSNADAALELLHALALRAAAMLPHQARFTFVDAATQGRAFPIARALPQSLVRVITADVWLGLDEARRDTDRLIRNYLDKQTPSFEMLKQDVRLNERFELLFVASYPDGFDRRAIETLNQIGRNGPAAGKYLFIHWNRDLAGPHDLKLDDFAEPYYVPLEAENAYPNYKLTRSRAPDPLLERSILDRLAASLAPDLNLPWENAVAPAGNEIWASSSRTLIETPVGRGGTGQPLKILFGKDREGQPCTHGLLAAMQGAGKSNLYHVLILGMAARYSPEELRMYLIDGKFGVEFQFYRKLPHADVVSLHTPPAVSISVLEELVRELEERNRLFTEHHLVDIDQYRGVRPLPRILLLIDEFQDLFKDDPQGVASGHLLKLVQRGRSAGIHLLLGSHTFGVPGLWNQGSVLASIDMRIGMQQRPEFVQSLVEFGAEGRRALAACDLPGKVVIRTRDSEAYLFGKLALLNAETREKWLEILDAKAAGLAPESRGRGIVCDGDLQPRFLENPFVRAELRRTASLPAAEREQIARKPLREGGFGAADWYTVERPFLIWLGQEFNVHGHAGLILRRRYADSALVVGGSDAARYGMFAAALLSLGLAANPGAIRIDVIDRSTPGAAWHGLLAEAAAMLDGHGIPAAYTRGGKDAERQIEFAAQEVERRRTLQEADLDAEPSRFLFVSDAERVRSLERRGGRFGEDSELGKRLQAIMVDGPPVGVHLVLGFTSFMPMTQILDPDRLGYFRHRVALQMSDQDSFGFLQTGAAATLQKGADSPISALYCDVAGGRQTLFKPYTVDEEAKWGEQLSEIANRLQRHEAAHGNG